MHSFQSVFEFHFRFIIQQLLRLPDRRKKPVLHIPVPSFNVHNPGLIARKLVHHVRHIYDPVLLARTQVDGFSCCLLLYTHRKKTVDDILNICPVPGLFSIARYREHSLIHCPVEEVWNNVPVSSRYFTRTKDIEEPGIDDWKPVQVVEIIRIKFSKKLCHLIWSMQVDRYIMLLKRHFRFQSVYAAPG